MQKLEQKVTHRILSLELKRAGIPQESEFWWVQHERVDGFELVPNTFRVGGGWKRVCSAFLSCELEIDMPNVINTNQMFIDKYQAQYLVGYANIRDDDIYYSATLADAFAECRLWLRSQGLIDWEKGET